MKILFIFPNFNASYCWSPAIQILSAVLKREGHETFLIHINDKYAFPNDKLIIAKEVQKINPDLIGFTGTSFDFPRINEICKAIKKTYNCPIILGGIHATIKPDDLQNSNFDAFCIGEGEKPFLELVKRMENKSGYLDVGSFWFKDNGNIIKNNTMDIIEDLNELPFNDWEVMDTRNLLLKRYKRLSIMISRGCPFQCSFCINQIFKKIKGLKNYTRFRNVDNAIAELKYLADKFDIEIFHFDDDMFLANKQWLSSFTERYREEIYSKYAIKYTIEARADTVTEDNIKLLKDSGCYEIRLGVETGDEHLRNGLLNKNLSDDNIIKTFDLCNKYDLKPSAFFMFGIPRESEASMAKTIEMIARIKPYLVRPTFYVPIYGTPLYEYCRDNNLMKEKPPNNQFSEAALKYENITEDALYRYSILLPWYVNLRLGHKNYIDAIKKFQDYTKEQLANNRAKILDEDKKLSEETKSLHYRYFESNINFIERAD